MRLSKKKGFSLIEILAVIFIVSIALVGVITLAHHSIRAQRLNKHTLIAYQLAQEGIELVRAVRDNNWKNDKYTFDQIFLNGYYCIDYERLSLEAKASPCSLYLVDGYYVHPEIASEDQLTPYSRLIEIKLLEQLPENRELIGTNQAIHVASRIYWEELGTTFEYVTATELYDWFAVK